MKYPIVTVFGALLLPIIKSKIGSSVRLKLKEFIEMKFCYSLDFDPEEVFSGEDEDEWVYLADNLVDRAVRKILTTESILKNGAKITDIDSVESFVSDPLEYDDNEVSVIVDVYVRVQKVGDNERQVVQETDFHCRKLLMDNLTLQELYPYGNNRTEIKRVIINADTGEEYKEPLKPISKLRRR